MHLATLESVSSLACTFTNLAILLSWIEGDAPLVFLGAGCSCCWVAPTLLFLASTTILGSMLDGAWGVAWLSSSCLLLITSASSCSLWYALLANGSIVFVQPQPPVLLHAKDVPSLLGRSPCTNYCKDYIAIPMSHHLHIFEASSHASKEDNIQPLGWP